MDEDLNFLHELIMPAQTKIVMIIMDGLGGLPLEPGGKTELETAHTPNLDALAGVIRPGADAYRSDRASRWRAVRVTWAFSAMTRSSTGSGAACWRRSALTLTWDPTMLPHAAITVRWMRPGVVTDRRAGRIANDISKELSKLLTTRIEMLNSSWRRSRNTAWRSSCADRGWAVR